MRDSLALPEASPLNYHQFLWNKTPVKGGKTKNYLNDGLKASYIGQIGFAAQKRGEKMHRRKQGHLIIHYFSFQE